MSSTLVSSLSSQYYPSRESSPAHHHHHQHHHPRHSPLLNPPPATPEQLYQNQFFNPEDDIKRRRAVEEIEGLSCLASQHHRSEYNRLKWGEKGAPLYYVPLSIQLPAHVSEIMNKQALFEAQCSENQKARHQQQLAQEDAENANMDALIRGPNGIDRPLEEEEGLEGVLVRNTEPAKGGTGGGEVTAIVPDETAKEAAHPTSELASLPAPSKQVEEQISQAMEDSLLPLSSSKPHHHQHHHNHHHHQQPNPPTRIQPVPLASGHVFTSIEMGRQEYQRKAQLEAPEAGAGSTLSSASLSNGKCQNQTISGQPPAQSMKTSDTHPINISIVVPPDYIHYLRPLLHLNTPPNIPTLLSTPPNVPPKYSPTFFLPPLLDLHRLSQQNPAIDPIPPISISPGGSLANDLVQGEVGNFLLSSCPGKKVRLQGPVKGRGAICRDLKVDLERIQGLGVGCIICCLDDDELGYLGAPIQEYVYHAESIGLEVIRIPMPEGLTPTLLPEFDAQISSIVARYTLKGINVLAHCRGGVGRAGLVASAWVVKMGLVSSSSFPSSDPDPVGRSFGLGGKYTAADLEITEKVISLVRRRRSVKAIETYEQVRWLVDYVRWLRVEGKACALEKPRRASSNV